ncbi:MAG TPA: uracil-DNA glycosylase family protein, partial [Nitrosospira sp.]|nr:uracil-DNA glycosylase family protein [Nitrosospira sp.]
ITNAVKCLPPENKPAPAEVRQCNHYLSAEIAEFRRREGKGLLALGAIAHHAVLMALGLKRSIYSFSHGAIHALPGDKASGRSENRNLTLYDSYHCSRYNTQTRRLTAEMFEQVFEKIRADITLHQKTGD